MGCMNYRIFRKGESKMRFRPCIDIHNGKVKQIVGGTLTDAGDHARNNFVSDRDASWYAGRYAKDHLSGGHVILLNAASSEYYAHTKAQALRALQAFPGGLQAGGGITPENAAQFLDAGASHVIVTSYVFRDGRLDEDALMRMVRAAGREHLVLDLSCAQDEQGQYRIVTDRWQKMSEMVLDGALLSELSGSCDEFLVHAVDVEGKQKGPHSDVLRILSSYAAISDTPVTYAGGIASMEDIERIRREGKEQVDFTVGSALDLFGGDLSYEDLAARYS